MENKFLKLTVKVFETLEPTLEPIAESTKDSKRKIFREILLKKRSQYGISSLIEETDFLTNCKNEVSQLKKKVIDRIELIKHNNSALRIIEIKISNQSNTDKKKEIDTIENEINEIYGKSTYISITEFVNTAVRKMCLDDIYFIESVFDSFDLIKLQPTKPEVFDTPKTFIIEKIITEKHNEMFSNNGFELFEYIFQHFIEPKEEKKRKADDIIFYVLRMINDETPFIHQKPTVFFRWFEKNGYGSAPNQLKTLDQVKNDDKELRYSIALEKVKSKNK